MLIKIREYIDNAFADVKDTKKIRELKDELYSNLSEQYVDYLSQEKTEQEAYHATIAGIGDLSELVDSVREPNPLNPILTKEREKNALIVSSSVALYILSPFLLILFSQFGEEVIGLLCMIFVVAIATSMLIYNNMTKSTYTKTQDTIVEDFKEWRMNNENTKAAYKAFSGAYWGLVVAIYLILNFVFYIWSFSWIIFIIAAAVQNIIKGILVLRGDKYE